MRKRLLTFIITSVVLAAFIVYALPYVKMEFASSATYTESDKREYNYYTPELLKKMPKISQKYYFRYSNISGPQAFVYSIIFEETTDTTSIRDYLLAKGYELQETCNVEAECWKAAYSNDIVTVGKITDLDVVLVQICVDNY
ncbi:hypothetical protein [Kalamiella sp. sgz302252]|uniref:hypothetical protein n=1 Tax=Pantoea sp. sgz302252 TaxID=3341827 RepID=UPI0036D3CFE1